MAGGGAAHNFLGVFAQEVPHIACIGINSGENLKELYLPMLIRSEGVGLGLQNRREKGKKNKEQTCILFPLCCLKLYVWEGGQGGQ